MSRTPEDIQDELLVLRCQEGDDDALRALITRWQPRLGRLAWRLTGNRESARDAVQETWLAIVRGLRRLDDPARFRSWAYRIAVNKCADWTRRRVVLRSAASDLRDAAASAPRAVTGAADQEDDAAHIRDAMAKLPGEQRAILSLHYLDEMGVSEIGEVLEIPKGTVKSRLHHARNRLRQALERMNE
ncbi:MAG: RNA polymerase sigma factor [Planctomycetes bacterium]|nr:RNA polymerase sigma factor [Planctomycetota bacterium]